MTHKKGKNYISTNIFYPARRGNHFACTRPSSRRANTHAGPQPWWRHPSRDDGGYTVLLQYALGCDMELTRQGANWIKFVDVRREGVNPFGGQDLTGSPYLLVRAAVYGQHHGLPRRYGCSQSCVGLQLRNLCPTFVAVCPPH